MAYATLAGFIKQYGENAVLLVADRDDDGVIDAPVVEDALARASAEIDSYVSAKHRLPLPVVPDRFPGLAGDIALYLLSSEGGALTEDKRKRYEDAISYLRRVASGDAGLGLPTPPDQESSGEAWFESQPKRFGDLL